MAKKVAKKVVKKAAKKVAKKVVKKAAKKVAKKVTKKAPAKVAKKVTKKAPAKVTKKAPVKIVRDNTKPLTKTQLIATMAEMAGLEKKQVAAVLENIPVLLEKELKKPGSFQLPGILKIEKKRVPAQKAMKNWTNPFTGEVGTKPAKPAHNKIKVRALKRLKDMA